MSSNLEPEIQFAQKLASNEKPIRTRALKKLRKYIIARSQRETGGFTNDELLKLWKGLFYCLWMQDKPILQENLSTQISSLIHSFQNLDSQLLFLESFMKTFKREWTGIDRLRMDKYYQLVRFIFRQTFEMLKRNNWKSSMIGRFLEVLTVQLLQSDSQAPIGLLFHVLDIYMAELALVGSTELTANQNLMFIEPYCKIAAKTKDQSLFSAICSGIFTTIIDQAPFAIEDLMKEVNAADCSDSGHSSEDENDCIQETTGKAVDVKMATKQLIDEDDNANTEHPGDDDDIGPVLQFDYIALADKLFELSSRSNTPSHNRKKLYKIIKVLRDLSEGIFPHNEYPEEVSTDEDDEMFGSRKRIKKSKFRVNNDDDEAPPVKKSKVDKKKNSVKQREEQTKKETLEDGGEPMDLPVEQKKGRGDRKKKRKAKRLPMKNTKENSEPQPDTRTKELQQTPATAQPKTSLEIDTPVSDRKTRKSLRVGKKLMKNTGENSEPQPDTRTKELQQTPATAQPKTSLEIDTPVSDRKTRKSLRVGKKLMKNTGENSEPQPDTRTKELQQTPATAQPKTSLEIDTPVSDRKTRKSLRVGKKLKSHSPKSESKTVTFGLNNNKTAEFRKTDSSLLVSPEGSSRVPFDPTQKPRFGVLKSSPTPVSITKKPAGNTNATTSLKSKKIMPQKRPLAADFF
ncbi:ribosomal RNA processing protein 1 homolog A isoform X3 [Cynoglossus semilaevis]|nr:ribosomal RNA processing protein 1 homolog A isoform X3 [Cynoglossus semilaevis]